MGFDVFYSMEESAGPDGFMSQVPEILMKVLRNPPNYSEKKAAPIPEIIHNLLCRTIVSVREGLFYTIFGCGDWVWQGRFIGMICDYEGNVVESVVSPIDGVIVELPESFYIPASGAICMIQPASSCF
jgi:hypothetical protein